MQQSHRAQALRFHRAILVIEIIYLIFYTCIKLFHFTSYTSAPIICGAFTILCLGASYVIGRRRSYSDICYARTLVAMTLASAPIIAMVHPSIQVQYTLKLTGECQEAHCEFGASDYRTDGPLLLQWLLCFMAVFMLEGLHAVLAPPLSIIVYQCLLLGLGGAQAYFFDYANWLVLGIPVCLCIGGRRISDEARRRVDALLLELEEQTLHERRLRIEAEMEIREQAAKLRAGIREEGEEDEGSASSGSLTYSLTSSPIPLGAGEAEQQSQQQREEEPQKQQGGELKEEPAPWQAVHPSLHPIELQGPLPRPARVSTSEQCTQTDIVMADGGFRCTCCSRPPRAPRQLQAPRAVGQGQSTSDTEAYSKLAAVRMFRGRNPKKQRGVQLRFPGVPPTPEKTQLKMLLTCSFAWNVKMSKHRCCDLHGLMDEVAYSAQKLSGLKCTPKKTRTSYSCSHCGLVTLEPQDAFCECRWCGEGFLTVPRRTNVEEEGSASDTSSSCSLSSSLSEGQLRSSSSPSNSLKRGQASL